MAAQIDAFNHVAKTIELILAVTVHPTPFVFEFRLKFLSCFGLVGT